MYVYAFSLAGDSLPALPKGIAQPLQTLQVSNLIAIVEPPLDLPSLQQDESRLVSAVVHHDWVLCELIQSSTLLPLRFGTQFSDRAQVRSHLQAQATPYTSQLTTLQNQLEFCLKLSPKPLPDLTPAIQTSPQALTGRAYFLAKKQRLQHITTAEGQLQAQRSQLQAQVIQQYPQHCLDNEHIYFLAHRHQVSQLQQHQQQWQQQFPHWTLQLTGPLPAYHFV